MSSIYIRESSVENTDKIVIEGDNSTSVYSINNNGESVWISSRNGWEVRVDNQEHAEYIIKALQKAIELGWF